MPTSQRVLAPNPSLKPFPALSSAAVCRPSQRLLNVYPPLGPSLLQSFLFSSCQPTPHTALFHTLTPSQAPKKTYLMRQRQTQPDLVRRNISVTPTLHHLERGGGRAGLDGRASDAEGVHRGSDGVGWRIWSRGRRDGPNALIGRRLRDLSFPELCGAGDAGLGLGHVRALSALHLT